VRREGVSLKKNQFLIVVLADDGYFNVRPQNNNSSIASGR
jgi:hypothetical protein